MVTKVFFLTRLVFITKAQEIYQYLVKGLYVV